MPKWPRLLLLLALLLGGCTDPIARPEGSPWANPFLEPNATVRLQIDHVPGHEPSASALQALLSVMEEVGTRATVDVGGRLAPKGRPYTVEDMLAIHAASYSGDPKTWRDAEGTPVLHVLYLDGNASFPGGGVYLVNTPAIAIFLDTMPQRSVYVATISNAPLLPGREAFERTMLIHEYGHALGLVGCSLPETSRRGSECHSPNPASVMNADYHVADDPLTWALEDDGGPVWRFDADDWADIRAGQAQLPTGSARPGSILSPTH